MEYKIFSASVRCNYFLEVYFQLQHSNLPKKVFYNLAETGKNIFGFVKRINLRRNVSKCSTKFDKADQGRLRFKMKHLSKHLFDTLSIQMVRNVEHEAGSCLLQNQSKVLLSDWQNLNNIDFFPQPNELEIHCGKRTSKEINNICECRHVRFYQSGLSVVAVENLCQDWK